MKRHIVVISDIHLSELEPQDGAWMRYRQAAQSPDPPIAAMIDALLAQLGRAREPEELTLALNGDIFDFDAPRVVDGRSVFHDDPRDDARSVPFIEAILDDHRLFVEALARALVAGHKVVFISGNHDAQVTLPGVRAVIRRRVVDAAAAIAGEHERPALDARLLFRAWFYQSEGGVHVEHGGQYDPYTAFHYPMAPYHKETKSVQPTLGSLATRLMTSRMGYFNPHVDVTYELSGPGYLAHWIRHYMGSPHSLLFAWLGGALGSFFRLIGARDPGSEERRRESFAEASLEVGLPEERLLAHAALFAAPVELANPIRAARELWVDRLMLTLGSTAWAAAFYFIARSVHPAILAAAPLGALAFAWYEVVTPKLRVRDRWRDVDDKTRDIAALHGARAVVFGHTHHPHGYWEDGVFFGNAGSWSAAYYDIECTLPVFPDKPLVWLTTEGDRITGGLMVWTGEGFEPREMRPAH